MRACRSAARLLFSPASIGKERMRQSRRMRVRGHVIGRFLLPGLYQKIFGIVAAPTGVCHWWLEWDLSHFPLLKGEAELMFSPPHSGEGSGEGCPSLCRPPAIDDNRLSGDVARVVAHQELGG